MNPDVNPQADNSLQKSDTSENTQASQSNPAAPAGIPNTSSENTQTGTQLHASEPLQQPTVSTSETSVPATSYPAAGQTPQIVVGSGGLENSVWQQPEQSNAKQKKKSLKLPLIILAAVIILGAGSAAAYFGVIVPNQPQNVLQAALINSVKENYISYNGSLSSSTNSSSGSSSAISGLAGKLDFNGQEDTVHKSADVNLALTISGVSVNAELRYLNQNVYIKFGDLSNLVTLANGIDPTIGTQAQAVSSMLSNKWIEIDSTLLNQAGVNCYLNQNVSLSNNEIKQVGMLYQKNQFLTIKSSKSTVLNGQPSEMFNLVVNDDKAANFLNGTNQLPSVQQYNKCGKSTSNTSTVHSDHKTIPLSLWVDKNSRTVSKISINYLDKSGGTNQNLNVNSNFSYKPVNIQAPSNAEPALNVLAQLKKTFSGPSSGAGLNLNSFFGGSGSGNISLH